MMNAKQAIQKAKELGLLEDDFTHTAARPTELGFMMYAILEAYVESVMEGKGVERPPAR